MNSYYAAVLDGENIVGIVLKDLRTNALRQYSIDETVQLAKSNEIMLMGVDEYGKLSVLKNESDIKEGASAAGGIIYDKDIEKFFRLNPRVHAEDIEWLRGGYGRIVMCPVYAKKVSGIIGMSFAILYNDAEYMWDKVKDFLVSYNVLEGMFSPEERREPQGFAIFPAKVLGHNFIAMLNDEIHGLDIRFAGEFLHETVAIRNKWYGDKYGEFYMLRTAYTNPSQFSLRKLEKWMWRENERRWASAE